MGHEAAGTVEQVGDGVSIVKPGDHVVLSFMPNCGLCRYCSAGRPHLCEVGARSTSAGTMFDGTTRFRVGDQEIHHFGGVASFGEYTVVNQEGCVPIRDDVPFDRAALVGCGVMTGVGAVINTANVEPGSTVVVIGAGGVGQFVVQGARIAGAGAIVCVDPIEARLERVRQLGATGTATPERLKETMREALPDGADYAFDAVGNADTSVLALRWTRNGGTCVLVGLPPAGARLDLDPADFSRREKFLTGSMYGSEDPAVALPVLLDHVRGGRLLLEPLVGPRYGLDSVNEAIEASLAGSPGRVLVTL